MTGKTHKAIGMCAGVAYGFWHIGTRQPVISLQSDMNLSFPYGEYLPMLAVCVVVTAAGAMLPDIDHDRSKLGSMRRWIITALLTVCAVAFVYVCKSLIDLRMYLNLAVILLVIIAAVVGLPILAKSKPMRKLPKISFKHRGIMHTLAVPLLLIIWSANIPNELLRMIVMAIAIGYLSHLFMDCLTKSGCPVLWPVWPGHVSILRVSTGTQWEYIVSFPMGVVILLIGVFFLNR